MGNLNHLAEEVKCVGKHVSISTGVETAVGGTLVVAEGAAVVQSQAGQIAVIADIAVIARDRKTEAPRTSPQLDTDGGDWAIWRSAKTGNGINGTPKPVSPGVFSVPLRVSVVGLVGLVANCYLLLAQPAANSKLLIGV